MTEKTSAKVYLSIHGDSFPVELLSEILKIQPTKAYRKGEEIIRTPNPNVIYSKRHFRQETAWELGTDYEVIYHIDELLTKISTRLINKEDIINNFCKAYKLECKFMVVIIIKNGETPSIVLNQEFISMANRIGAEIEFDLYAHSF